MIARERWSKMVASKSLVGSGNFQKFIEAEGVAFLFKRCWRTELGCHEIEPRVHFFTV